jgi:hypothetical protein
MAVRDLPLARGSWARQALSKVLRAGWQRALVGGSATYALVLVASVDTQSIHPVPVVLLLGAALAYRLVASCFPPPSARPRTWCYAVGIRHGRPYALGR